jgi:predicted nucleic acid-binding protein
MQKVLHDTSLYVHAFRNKNVPFLVARSMAPSVPVYMSSVVLEELYAGSDQRDRREIEHIEREFDRLNRVVVPNLTDWTKTGKVLSLIASKYGYEAIGQARLTNDTLIAVSASRLGVRVFTTNEKDFSRIAEFHPFQWQLTSFP